MAPEQFDEDPTDARTDLYSLGCVLYFTLAGAYPFVGESVEAVAAAHINHVLHPLKAARPDLPDVVCAWIENLMECAPDNRPATARQALSSLRHAAAAEGISYDS
jgi:serine/threonine protein kinase